MLATKFEETRVYQETRQEERQAIALKMLRKNMPVETIAEITELTIAQIQALQGYLN